MDIAFSDSMRRLDVTLYGNVEPLSDTLSKCRVRIFYRGLNRNRTYISEDFANQLIKSLPYAPIKGIFNKDDIDYEDHGEDNTDGRIYGVVPENPNVSWEKHVDNDGVEREYACADVILYTALYPEANLISGKSQSMEIHKIGLTGEWKIWDGDRQPYYEFHTGHLLGLQVLGDGVEPCFEGSAFFSLYKDAKDLYDYIKNSNAKEESEKMDRSKFRLSDNDKFELLWQALNTSEDSFTTIYAIYDDYAVAYDAVAGNHIRVYYTKDNEANTVTVNNIEVCYIVDVTEAEKNALEAMKAIGAYTDIQAKLDEYSAQIAQMTSGAEEAASKYAQLESELEAFKKKNEDEDKDDSDDDDGDDKDKDKDDDEKKKTKNELDVEDTEAVEPEVNSTVITAEFEAKISEKDAEIARLNQLVSDITNEKAELESFKLNADREKKTAILNEFAAHLTEEQFTEYTNKVDNYSVEDFKKEVCVAAYDTDSSLFAKKDVEDLIHKPDSEKSYETGALRLLNKHKGGNR